jgi:anti-sigma-K factor RskA
MNRRELASAYLLDALEPDERAKVERRLAGDAELRAEVDAARALTARLEALPEDAWPMDASSEADAAPARDPAVAGSAVADAKPAVAPVGRGRRRWTIRPAFALAALLVVAALGFGLGALLNGGGSSKTAPTIVLRPLEATAGEEATVAMPAPGEMLFTAEGLPTLKAGQYYEIWLMSSSSKLVPVASFRVGADGRAQVRVPLPADPTAYRYFDVSRQVAGAGTEHSADSVLRGSTS